MQKLNTGIGKFFDEMGQSDDAAAKAVRAAKVQNLYKQAIVHIYKDSAFLILEKTNAVYIFNEKDKGLRRKALPEDKTIKRMVIYTCDSMVHADLDSRQEFLKVYLANHGEVIDKLDLLTSKMGMRKRFPYADDVAKMKQNLSTKFGTKFDFLNTPENSQPSLTDAQKEQLEAELSNIESDKLRTALKELILSNNHV